MADIVMTSMTEAARKKYAIEFARKGGIAGMKALTAEQRKAKAKAAADARWSKAKEQVKAETADSRPPKSKKTKVA